MAGSGPAASDLSGSALRLHARALLDSLEAGRAGLVTTAYLLGRGSDRDALAADVEELVTAGVWARVPDGFRVIPSEALRMADEVDRLVAEARDHLRGER